jgi:hypothetical protein
MPSMTQYLIGIYSLEHKQKTSNEKDEGIDDQSDKVVHKIRVFHRLFIPFGLPQVQLQRYHQTIIRTHVNAMARR